MSNTLAWSTRKYRRATTTVMVWRVTLDNPRGAYRGYITQSRLVRAAQ